MLIKALAAAITVVLATAIGQWMEHPNWGVALGLLSVFAMTRAPKTHFLSMTLMQKARLRKDFHFLELTAWFARPAIYILDKERPGWTRSEMRILFQNEYKGLPSHVGTEKEVVTHLYRISQLSHRPDHAYEKLQRQLDNRFTRKHAQKRVGEIFATAAHLIARVNAPDEATAWLCVQADDFGYPPATILEAINRYQKLLLEMDERIAVVKQDYPMSYFPNDMLPAHRNSMRYDQDLNDLHRDIYIYRQHNAQLGVETEQADYARTFREFVEFA